MGMILGRISEEMPKHVVVHRTANYEVWRYTSSSVAAVVHAIDLKDPKTNEIPTDQRFSSMAFGMLARYIGVFGNPQNEASSTGSHEAIAMTAPVIMDPPTNKEKIAMTAPVIMDPADGASNASGSAMKFLLPSKYQTLEETPKPTNPAVKLEIVPAGRCEAVRTFSGNFNMKRATEEATNFLEVLKQDQEKIKVIGDWTAQGYNPPFTLPFLKRSEIHVPVDPTPFDGIESLN